MKKVFIYVPLFFFLSITVITGQENLFPQITGWNLEADKTVYTADNLWDLIDGAADLFLEYSFNDLHQARYKNSSDIEIRVELYKHATNLDAFGIYSAERDPGYKFINIGVQGYNEEGIINFLSGNYYIKLSTLQKGESAEKNLLEVARAIEKKLGGDNQLPAEFKLFPSSGKTANTEKYVSQNFWGYSFLKSVFTVKYSTPQPFTGFIIKTENPGSASSLYNELLKALKYEGGQKNNIAEIDDPQNGKIVSAKKGQYIYGMIGCNDKTAIEKFISELGGNLK